MKSLIQVYSIALISLLSASAAPAAQDNGLADAFLTVETTPNPPSVTKHLSKRYSSGWCGFHITQHQKNEYGVGADYKFDIRIHDAIQALIGGVNGLDIPNYGTADVASQLPYQLVITVGVEDNDPLKFAYAGAEWQSDDRSHCSMGGYDSGARNGDCGFTC